MLEEGEAVSEVSKQGSTTVSPLLAVISLSAAVSEDVGKRYA